MGPARGILGQLGTIQGPSLGNFGSSLKHFCSFERHVWATLGSSWAILGHLGPSWDHFGPSWAILGPSWDDLGHLNAMFRLPWGHLGLSWAILGHLGTILGRSWTKIVAGVVYPNDAREVWSPFWVHFGVQNWSHNCKKCFKY